MQEYSYWLSAQDLQILERCKSVVDLIGCLFGDCCECILYKRTASLSEQSVIYLHNGTLTGRQIGHTIDSKAWEILQQAQLTGCSTLNTYTSQGKNGCNLRTCTLTLFNYDTPPHPIGVLCISFNLDCSCNQLLQALNGFQSPSTHQASGGPQGYKFTPASLPQSYPDNLAQTNTLSTSNEIEQGNPISKLVSTLMHGMLSSSATQNDLVTASHTSCSNMQEEVVPNEEIAPCKVVDANSNTSLVLKDSSTEKRQVNFAQRKTAPESIFDVNDSYPLNADAKINNAIFEAQKHIQANPSINKRQQNKAIITHLYERGIFNMRAAVKLVSDSLEISDDTVYFHLRELKKA